MLFRSFLSGKTQGVVINFDVIEINQELKGDFFNDPEYKELFCQWLNLKWIEKDEKIGLIQTD